MYSKNIHEFVDAFVTHYLGHPRVHAGVDVEAQIDACLLYLLVVSKGSLSELGPLAGSVPVDEEHVDIKALQVLHLVGKNGADDGNPVDADAVVHRPDLDVSDKVESRISKQEALKVHQRVEGELLAPQDSSSLHVDGLAGSHELEIAKAVVFDGPLGTATDAHFPCLSNFGTGASLSIVAHHGETFAGPRYRQLATDVLWVAQAELEDHVSDFRSKGPFPAISITQQMSRDLVGCFFTYKRGLFCSAWGDLNLCCEALWSCVEHVRHTTIKKEECQML